MYVYIYIYIHMCIYMYTLAALYDTIQPHIITNCYY